MARFPTLGPGDKVRDKHLPERLSEEALDGSYAPIDATVDALTDATVVGKSVAKAANAAAARAAIDAASPAQITAAVNGLVNAAPGQLDTLKELSDALGGDQNFATTITAALGSKVERPSGGTDGQVLVRSGSSVAWATVSGGSSGYDGGQL